MAQDLPHVVADLQEAHCVAAAAEACRFLVDLLRIAGVQKEVARRGGWTEVEQLAATSRRYQLYKCCPQDAHFVLLSEYNVLYKRLLFWLPMLTKAARPIARELEGVETRFRCTTKSKDLIKRFGVVIDTVKQHVQHETRFPRVKTSSSRN
jgi:hypothetical protein